MVDEFTIARVVFHDYIVIFRTESMYPRNSQLRVRAVR